MTPVGTSRFAPTDSEACSDLSHPKRNHSRLSPVIPKIEQERSGNNRRDERSHVRNAYDIPDKRNCTGRTSKA
jgi:hypothetical protein